MLKICALCLQVCLIVFCVVFIAHHRPVMFKRVPQVSGAFSNLELDGGQWRRENETSVRGKINVYFLLVELYSSSGELQEWSFQKMFNKKANLLHQCSKNCMHVKDLLVFQLSTCTVYMYNDVWFVRNFEERLKGEVTRAKLWNGIPEEYLWS